MARKFQFDLTIEPKHLDFFGHVNNATYLQLFESARWDIMNGAGYGRERVQELQIGPVILEVHVRFRKELKEGQQVQIHSEWIQYQRRVSRIRQEIVDSEGIHYADAQFKSGLFDLKRRKLIGPTNEWLDVIGWVGDVEQ